jgi:hypothetical protein
MDERVAVVGALGALLTCAKQESGAHGPRPAFAFGGGEAFAVIEWSRKVVS